MRKTTMIGISVLLLGASLIVYSIFQDGDIGADNSHLAARNTLVIGFVMVMGGGLISLSPFGKK